MERGEFGILEFKATETADAPAGLFAALVSVFGTKDRVGDRVMPGAFTKTLEQWRASGEPIPVIWSHNHNNPEDYIGTVDPNDVRETEKGLVVAGRIDVAETKGMRVFNLLKRGLIRNWSFAYTPTKAKMGKAGERVISELDLYEVGPTLVGAHAGTRTLALKALDLDTEVDWDAIEAEVEALGHGEESLSEKAVDDSAWDGNAAMSACESASDYRSICAGERTVGDPDERLHWALPHHKSPGSPPNASGVRQALGRVSQTQNLKSAEAARSHLEAHMSSINPQGASARVEGKLEEIVADEFSAFESRVDELIQEKVGRVISARTASRIRTALDELTTLLVEAGVQDTASVESEQPESTTEETPEATSEEDSEETAPTERELVRASLQQYDAFMTMHGRK